MTVRAHMQDLIDAHADAGQATSPLALSEEFRLEHPDLWAEYQERLGMSGLRSMARSLLRERSHDDQLVIGDLDLPRWVAVPDGEGDFVHVPLQRMLMRDYLTHIESVLRANVDAASSELRRHELTYRRLSSLPDVTPETPVLEAVSRLP